MYRVYYRENLHPIQNKIVLERCHNCSYSEVHVQNKFPRHQMYSLRIANFSNTGLEGSWYQTTWREEMVTHCSNRKLLIRKRNSTKNSDTKKEYILTAFFSPPNSTHRINLSCLLIQKLVIANQPVGTNPFYPISSLF